MATHKLDPDALRRFLEADRSQAQAARHFGVSEAAISQQVRKLRLATSKVVALEKAGARVEEKLSASAQPAHAQLRNPVSLRVWSRRRVFVMSKKRV